MDYINQGLSTINKLANAGIQAVVSNPLIKEFEMLEQKGSAGPWTVHNALKRSTKQVFYC